MRRLLASGFTHKFLAGFALGAVLVLGVQQGIDLDPSIPQAAAETTSAR
ncbi:hypothetical protein ACNI3Q_06005 [Sphingomonas sp. FW199]|nr:hypothetical protein [Sphingomonas sp. BGYR3]MDG5488678.1 hypothetical protein [Sphingomonas sp. BGYR3]